MSDWTDEIRAAVDALEEKYDISVCSGDHCDELAEELQSTRQHLQEAVGLLGEVLGAIRDSNGHKIIVKSTYIDVNLREKLFQWERETLAGIDQ